MKRTDGYPAIRIAAHRAWLAWTWRTTTMRVSTATLDGRPIAISNITITYEPRHTYGREARR